MEILNKNAPRHQLFVVFHRPDWIPIDPYAMLQAESTIRRAETLFPGDHETEPQVDVARSTGPVRCRFVVLSCLHEILSKTSALDQAKSAFALNIRITVIRTHLEVLNCLYVILSDTSTTEQASPATALIPIYTFIPPL
jgi:hypothetical protein